MKEVIDGRIFHWGIKRTGFNNFRKVIILVMVTTSRVVRANTEVAEYDEYVSSFVEEGKCHFFHDS